MNLLHQFFQVTRKEYDTNMCLLLLKFYHLKVCLKSHDSVHLYPVRRTAQILLTHLFPMHLFRIGKKWVAHHKDGQAKSFSSCEELFLSIAKKRREQVENKKIIPTYVFNASIFNCYEVQVADTKKFEIITTKQEIFQLELLNLYIHMDLQWDMVFHLNIRDTVVEWIYF